MYKLPKRLTGASLLLSAIAVPGQIAATYSARQPNITGSPLPSQKLNGVNILPLMKGDQNANPREYLYCYYQKNSPEAVRKGNWKLLFPHRHRSSEGVMPGNGGYPGAGRLNEFYLECMSK